MHIREIDTFEAFKEVIYKIEDVEYHKGNEEFLINKKWTVGGIGGGSCWDQGGEERDPHYQLEEEYEPEDNTITIILENLFPEITLKSFFEKNESCLFWDEDSDFDCDYYGNHTSYSTKSLKLVFLFETMKAMSK